MGYITKEQKILKALEKQNYKMFDGNKNEALDFIESTLTAFPTYANTVIREQIMTPIRRQRYEGQELRDKIQDIDEQRHWNHESAISSVNMLNRLSRNLGLELFANINTNDRHAVANMVGQYVNEVYNKGIGNTFDEATYRKSKEYDTGEIKKHLHTFTEPDHQTGEPSL